MTFYDLEHVVFNAIFNFYMFWFSPRHQAVRLVGNIILGVHMLGVVVIGGILASSLWAQTQGYTNIRPTGELERQIIVNTGRLDQLEQQQRNDMIFETAMLKETAEISKSVSLVQQELTLYRWALGIIYIVLVGQLGVAVFSLLMRRESDRQYDYRHKQEKHKIEIED
jgi:hypothetical protein